MQGPLEYIRVLDLTIACAGRTAVRLLADWGAGVIKVRAAAAQPGESDRALLGHPRMFTYCLAEDEENSPLLPNLGYQPDDSVVTVISAEVPHSAIYSGGADDPEDANKLLQLLAIGVANMGTNNAVLTVGGAAVVLNPEHAEIFAWANMSRRDFQQGLWQATHYPKDRLGYFAQGFAARLRNQEYRCFDEPEDILLLMAEGSGLYSMVMPSWCAGANRNR